MRPHNPEQAALRLYIAVSVAAETGAGFNRFKVGDELHPPICRCLAALTALSRQIAFAVLFPNILVDRAYITSLRTTRLPLYGLEWNPNFGSLCASLVLIARDKTDP
jgi:hypothetical protein